MKINDTDALLVIDAQPTFMPGGGLPVTDGDKVVPVIKRLLPLFTPHRRIATKDRHPRGHISLASSYVSSTLTPLPPMTVLTEQSVSTWQFMSDMPAEHHIAPHSKFTYEELLAYVKRAGSQVLWPDHAIAGTGEAELDSDHPDSAFGYVLVKGTDPACDSYSAFRDNLKRPTELADVLRERGVRRIFCAGLAFDYCVGYTALDGAADSFETFVIEDATQPVGFPEGQVEATRAAFAKAGVRVIQSSELLQ